MYGAGVSPLPRLHKPNATSLGEGLRKPALHVAAIFWAFTYLMLTLRAELRPGDAALFSERRFLVTCAGAVIYGAVLRQVFAGRQGRLTNGTFMGLLVIGGAVLLFTVRHLYDAMFLPEPSVVESVRWTLVWSGYFAAWVFGWVALRPVVMKPDQTATRATHPLTSLWVAHGRHSVQVSIDQIRFIRAEGNYVRVFHRDGSGLMRVSLAELEARLAPYGFLRLHRSALCNRAHVASLRRNVSGTLSVVIDDCHELPVGRRYAAQVLTLLKIPSHSM
jgi:hypothetical protein